MSDSAVGASAVLSIGSQGQVVLPADVLRAAQLSQGDEVEARCLGDGSIVIEARSAGRDRDWSPAGARTSGVGQMRDEDARISDENSARRSGTTHSKAESAAIGAALLASLGL